ncbi:hypothetical protein V1264_023810 [Littorina saxatilis]|uniref:Profilin n=1 Tax=Littorina saxatilis TaxID=31220 RepID=A0AAN9B964_9CAEN
MNGQKSLHPHASPRERSGEAETGGSTSGRTSQWSDYIHVLLDRGHASRCAIYSKRGQQWAASGPDFAVGKKQFRAIMQGFQDAAELRCVGLQLADVSFTLTRLANRNCMMIGRCAATGSGCIIYKCRRCVVIATHEDAVQPGACFSGMEKLGDFLVDRGY